MFGSLNSRTLLRAPNIGVCNVALETLAVRWSAEGARKALGALLHLRRPAAVPKRAGSSGRLLQQDRKGFKLREATARTSACRSELKGPAMILRLIFFLFALVSLMPVYVSLEALGYPSSSRRFTIRGLNIVNSNSPLYYSLCAFFGFGIFTFLALSTAMLAGALSCLCAISEGL
jgi:hypothetical protein